MHRLKKILTSVLPKPENSLNCIHIHKNRLLDNLAVLQKITSHHTIFPVLKSNAYGHGIKEMSTILKNSDVQYICVDSYPEYQIVKEYAQKKVLIMGETVPENYSFYNPKRATPVVWTIETLKALITTGKKRTIHLFLNTGMNREWIQESEHETFLTLLNSSENITLEWVMSHFANADEIDSSFNEKQIETFKSMFATIEKTVRNLNDIKYRHIANSAWIVKMTDTFFNAARSWIALYWYNPLHEKDPYYKKLISLQPALDIVSTVTALQHVLPNEIVSYSWRRVAWEKTTIATIPFWYYEWLHRSLTNNRHYGRKDTILDQVGTICMNISSCDAKDLPVSIGDTITIISSHEKHPNTINAFAKKTGTIPYEILVKLNEKTRRKIVD